MNRYVVGISGASGITLAFQLIEFLVKLGHRVELIMTPHAGYAASFELGKAFSTPQKFYNQLSLQAKEMTRLHASNDIGSAISSGSYLTSGMVIVPCSMATVAAVAHGFADNGLRRAADVSLKEKRKLILVPRECPFSEIHLENMLKLARMGAIIVPPIPAWYVQPKTLQDIENFIVGKILDALNLEHCLYPKWSGSGDCESTFL